MGKDVSKIRGDIINEIDEKIQNHLEELEFGWIDNKLDNEPKGFFWLFEKER